MEIKKKNILLWLLLFIFALGLAELICFVTFGAFKERFTFFGVDNYFPAEEYISYAHLRYHPERGWDNFYSTKFGERPRAYLYNDPFISVFGDSFTHCDDVKDNETWQEYLAVLLKKDVYNFGTGGYGTDQAYLKFLSIFPEVRTPVVMLGLTTENISRIVSVYRPFYFEKTGIRLTKPRFVLKQDRLSLLPNPVRSPAEIKNLRSAYFLSRIGKNDYWFNRDRYPEFRFPYLRILFNKRIWQEIIYAQGKGKVSDIRPRPYINLWEDPGSTALMSRILESFGARAKEHNAIPVVIILPLHSEVVEKFKYGKSSLGEKKILDICSRDNILLFNAIEALARGAGSLDEIDAFFDTHISVRGNQIIAQHLYGFLKDSVIKR